MSLRAVKLCSRPLDPATPRRLGNIEEASLRDEISLGRHFVRDLRTSFTSPAIARFPSSSSYKVPIPPVVTGLFSARPPFVLPSTTVLYAPRRPPFHLGGMLRRSGRVSPDRTRRRNDHQSKSKLAPNSHTQVHISYTPPPRSAIADSLALHSWEIGTELEALTELEWPSLAVFEGDLPPPTELTDSDNAADVIAIATE